MNPTKQIMGLDKSIWLKRHLIGIMGQLYPTYLLICTVTIELAMTSHVWLYYFYRGNQLYVYQLYYEIVVASD